MAAEYAVANYSIYDKFLFVKNAMCSYLLASFQYGFNLFLSFLTPKQKYASTLITEHAIFCVLLTSLTSSQTD